MTHPPKEFNRTNETIRLLKVRSITNKSLKDIAGIIAESDYIKPDILREFTHDLRNILDTFSAKYGLSSVQMAYLLNSIVVSLIDYSC
jgi:hypothetical protein